MKLPTLEEFFVAHGTAIRAPRTVLPFHRRIFSALTRWVTGSLPGGKRNLAVCMPPRHGKTFIARDLVAWGLGAWPDSEWIYTSCSAKLAVTQTMAIKNAVSSAALHARSLCSSQSRSHVPSARSWNRST